MKDEKAKLTENTDDEKIIKKKIYSFLKWAAVIVGVYIFLKFIIPLILPFVIAFCIALPLQVPIRILNKRTKIPKKILSAIFLIAAVFGLCFVVFLIGNRLIAEIGRFVLSMNENSSDYVSSFFNYLDNVAKKFPFIEELGGDFSGMVTNAVNGMISNAASKIPQIIANFIGMLPEILLFTVVLIIASYYFCADYDKIMKKFYDRLSPKGRGVLDNFRKRLASSGISYLKSCLILALVTFIESLIGFLMLGVNYSFTLALIVAAVDFLPILGAGTVILPWSLICFISGDRYTAVGLLLIYTVLTLVRRFIEPRVISHGIGLSPLLTLLSLFIGFKLFGFAGLFFAPIIAVLVIHLLPEKISEKLGIEKIDGDNKKDHNGKNEKKLTKRR